MNGLVVFISLTSLAVCQADVAVAPPIRCGQMPMAVYRCLRTPLIDIVQPGVDAECRRTLREETRFPAQYDRSLNECELDTCLIRKSGWMDGDKVDKVKLAEFFENFAKDNPEWQAAVDVVKSSCLQADLPPQGIYLNCPAYDVIRCSFAALIRSASPSQWETSKECEYPRQYAAACPVCPSDCFGGQIPVGSCNACLAVPGSP